MRVWRVHGGCPPGARASLWCARGQESRPALCGPRWADMHPPRCCPAASKCLHRRRTMPTCFRCEGSGWERRLVLLFGCTSRAVDFATCFGARVVKKYGDFLRGTLEHHPDCYQCDLQLKRPRNDEVVTVSSFPPFFSLFSLSPPRAAARETRWTLRDTCAAEASSITSTMRARKSTLKPAAGCHIGRLIPPLVAAPPAIRVRERGAWVPGTTARGVASRETRRASASAAH